eukprot:TRINITY_DN19267_c0_g1_i1.p1 TRINITY_DN19267_c0_g1~~TRINITY_DN19267_c0_g1_i1.p1  ORF type:complete len:387 (-),score=49.96 TRINITY_DN19267_c0_g1_i1:248-1300(-)
MLAAIEDDFTDDIVPRRQSAAMLAAIEDDFTDDIVPRRQSAAMLAAIEDDFEDEIVPRGSENVPGGSSSACVSPLASACVSPTASEGPHRNEDLDCAVCLEILCEPLRLACSHTFCRACCRSIFGSLRAQRHCPLCRAVVSASFNPDTADADVPLDSMVRALRGQDLARRMSEIQAAASRSVRMVFGNRHELVANPKPSKNGKLNKHRWTAFVELESLGQSTDVEMLTSELIASVCFKIAPYYTAWPSSDKRSVRVGKNPEVRSAPFEVRRVGWGYFPVKIVVRWQEWLGLPEMTVEHELCFDGDGRRFTRDVDVGGAFLRTRTTGSEAGMRSRSAINSRSSSVAATFSR